MILIKLKPNLFEAAFLDNKEKNLFQYRVDETTLINSFKYLINI